MGLLESLDSFDKKGRFADCGSMATQQRFDNLVCKTVSCGQFAVSCGQLNRLVDIREAVVLVGVP